MDINKDLADKILSKAETTYTKCCIYFLIKDKEIIYIGQTTNLLKRLATHQQHHPHISIRPGSKYHESKTGAGSIHFDSFTYIECDKKDLDRLEEYYIFNLLPKLNHNSPRLSNFISLYSLVKDTGLTKNILIDGLKNSKQYIINKKIYYNRKDIFGS